MVLVGVVAMVAKIGILLCGPLQIQHVLLFPLFFLFSQNNTLVVVVFERSSDAVNFLGTVEVTVPELVLVMVQPIFCGSGGVLYYFGPTRTTTNWKATWEQRLLVVWFARGGGAMTVGPK